MAFSWREEYVAALHERDKREKASYERIDDRFIEAYTTLLARTAALEAEKAANTPSTPSKDIPQGISNSDNPQLRADLAEALRSNGTLQTRIKAAESELSKLRSKTKTDTKIVEELTRERAILAQKVRDRDEELRGKAKFLENNQDEMISINLQLNIAEQTANKLKKENQDLIDRWMARMGVEADEMNKELG